MIGLYKMLEIIRDIIEIRKRNRNNILLIHICVVAAITVLFFISRSELFIIVRALCICYSCLCVYLLISESIKFYFLFWPIFLHTIFFISIEIEEKGLNYFLLIYLLTIVLSIFLVKKQHHSKMGESSKELGRP